MVTAITTDGAPVGAIGLISMSSARRVASGRHLQALQGGSFGHGNSIVTADHVTTTTNFGGEVRSSGRSEPRDAAPPPPLPSPNSKKPRLISECGACCVFEIVLRHPFLADLAATYSPKP